MITPGPWYARTWTFDLPPGAFPGILERLRGAPARADELVRGWPEEALAERVRGRWSVKDHLGHLADLGRLDDRRLGEFLTTAVVLSPADPRNDGTERANHPHRPIARILEGFRVHRTDLVSRLEVLTPEDLARTSLHPRLEQPMRLTDWLYFVAEHDDHHLAHARGVLRSMDSRRA